MLIVCNHCQTTNRVPESAAGKRGKVDRVLRNRTASSHVEASKGSKGRVRRSGFWRQKSRAKVTG